MLEVYNLPFLDNSSVGSYTVSSPLELLIRMFLKESVSIFPIQLVHVLIYCTTMYMVDSA